MGEYDALGWRADLAGTRLLMALGHAPLILSSSNQIYRSAVLSAMAGSRYWPEFRGAILLLEEVNEYIYRVDRMLSTLQMAGALDGLAGVVLGGFTNCGPGEGHGALTLDEIFDDYFKPLGVPVFSGDQERSVPVTVPLRDARPALC